MSNKTSDKNVANIEIIENFILELKDFELNKDTLEVANELEKLLAEREQMLIEREKYTIRLTDEEYRKVIENAQMDTSNDRVIAHKFAIMQQQINEKDKRIQELEAKLEFKKFGDLDNVEFEEYMSQFIPKQVVIDKIEELGISDEDINIKYVLQKLLEGEK